MTVSALGNLQGKKAVVTGSSSGIGKAIALELARGGADVIIHCRKSYQDASSVASQIAELGRQSAVETADLSVPAEAADFAVRAWSRFAGLDIWVNNAGVDLLTGAAAKLDFLQKLQQLLDMDVRSSIQLSKTVGKSMQSAGRGVILNIGWDQAATGMEGDSGELFAAAKAAIMSFSRSLAVSLAPAVRVNCIAPGWIKTAWGESVGTLWQERVIRETPLKRWGTPEDIAKYARFLCSDDAAYITGQVINVNGGAIR